MEFKPAFDNLESFEKAIADDQAALCYFSHDQCNVCKVLKPKVYNMLRQKFPGIRFYYINTKETPEIAAQNSVFTVPTIIQFFEGREFFRKSRNISIPDIEKELQRPYDIMFEE